MRVDDRDRRRQLRRHAVVVGDDDVDAARRPRPRSRRRCVVPHVDGDDDASRRSRRAASTAASDRPWPSSSRLGTYGSTSTPYRRNARTRIASPSRPSASKSPKTMTRSPRSRARGDAIDEDVGVGQQRGSCSPSSGSANQASRRPPSVTPRRGEQPGHRGRRCHDRGRARGVRSDRRAVGKAPAEAGFQHDLRMPRGAHRRFARHGCAATRSGRARGARAGRPSRRPWRRSSHAASPRAAGWPRRSTSTSRSRCR